MQQQTLEAIACMPLFGAGSGRDMALPHACSDATPCVWIGAHPVPVWDTDPAPGLHFSRGALCRRGDAPGHFWQTSPMTRQLS